MPRLPRAFYTRPTPIVARDLLGALLVRRLPTGERLSARIVETEAYHGSDDTACHARAGETPRTAVMFREGGHAYVYLIYGMYNMLNITANEAGFPGAVLIRGVEPVEGIETMLELRGGRPSQLTNGPGRLCTALAIDRGLNGADLTVSDALWIEERAPIDDARIELSPRIGIDYAEPEHREVLWRYFERGNRWVSPVKGKRAPRAGRKR
jgi:DNA-3-methyladenine glycosylase